MVYSIMAHLRSSVCLSMAFSCSFCILPSSSLPWSGPLLFRARGQRTTPRRETRAPLMTPSRQGLPLLVARGVSSLSGTRLAIRGQGLKRVDLFAQNVLHHHVAGEQKNS